MADKIIYLVELARRTEYKPELALSSCLTEKLYNISVIQTGRPEIATYWTNWGGTYDNPEFPGIQLLFESYLIEVSSLTSLKNNVGSFLVTENFIYINLYKKPWQFQDEVTEASSVEIYSTSVRDENNPSDIHYEDSLGNNIKIPVRLNIPSVNISLSDPINGFALYSTFSVSLINEDGYFDDIQTLNVYNTPIKIKRTVIHKPKLSDFDVIRYGFVDNVEVTPDSLIINCAESVRSLTYPVTDRITIAKYPTAPAESIGKSIPIGYGELYGVPLINVGTNKYIALDSAYLTSVSAVYKSDGTSITFTLTAEVIDAIDAAYADVIGKTNNTIGEIITSEIENKSLVPYEENPWDKTETDYYISISPQIGFYFSDGDLRTLITSVLQNDNAFLVTKNDGRLTLRRWGENYTTHNLSSWQLMEIPTKTTHEAVKLYCSSILIEYLYNHNTQKYSGNFIDDSMEVLLNELYRRKSRVTFKTDLLNSTDAEDLADRLLDRFGVLSENMTLKLGVSTHNINILDKINVVLNINGRIFSVNTDWIVVANDPGQDTITIESI